MNAEGTAEVRLGVLIAELKGVNVWRDQPFLPLELIAHQILQDGEIDVQQRRKGPDVNDVLKQEPLSGIGVFPEANFRQGKADVVDIVPKKRGSNGFVLS